MRQENINLQNIGVTGIVALFIITLPKILENIPPILDRVITLVTLYN